MRTSKDNRTIRIGKRQRIMSLVVAIAVAAWGCAGTEEVLVVAPLSSVTPPSSVEHPPSLEGTPNVSDPEVQGSSLVPTSGEDKTDSESESGDGPGGGPEGGGNTGVPGDVAGGLPGPESATGGLVWTPEPDLWAQSVGEVFDWCDDAAATLATFGRAPEPGEDPAEVFEEYELQLAMSRFAVGAQCDVPGGKRYSAYVHRGSLGFAFATVAEAMADRDEELARGADHRTRFPEGYLLGYLGEFKREFPLEPTDEVVVLTDTVTVKDGAVRGLVHNLSRTRFARDVVVTARPAATESNSQQSTLSWYWPLTVQPGERAPFEIENWAGLTDLTAIDIQVAATLSDDVDISRAFALGGGPIGSDPIEAWGFNADLRVPTSHPHLESAILGQTIQDLRAYAAFIQDGRVIDLQKLRTWAAGYYGENGDKQEVVDIDSFPISADDLPEPIASKDDLYFVPTGFTPFFSFSFAPQGDGFQLWAGGANPPPAQQPTGGKAAG